MGDTRMRVRIDNDADPYIIHDMFKDRVRRFLSELEDDD